MNRLTLPRRLSKLLPIGVRRMSLGELIVWCSWGGLLISVESLGRRTSEEWVDFGAALAVLSWAAATAVIHQARPLSALAGIVGRLPSWEELLRPWRLDWGVDLRRTPAIRRSLPQAWKSLAVSIAGGSAALTVLVVNAPSGVRDWWAARLYLAYLIPWSLLVGTAFFLITILVFLIWAELHERALAVIRFARSRNSFGRFLLLGLILGVLSAGACILPAWVPLLGMVVVLAGMTLLLAASSRDLVLVWRQERRGRYGSFDGRLFIWFQASVVVVLLADFVMLLGGAQELPTGGDWRIAPFYFDGRLLPPSQLLARVVGWLSLGASWGVALDATRLAIQGITFHPLRISQREGRLLSPEVDFEQRRRLEIQCRRKIVRGIERLFKLAASRSQSSSSGRLLGVQHWFILGMRCIDGEEPPEGRETRLDEGFVGPPFHRLFSKTARYHYWQICTALEIDLVYVENSVSFRRFVRVLRVMFEVYDMQTGGRRIEERDFLGIPGVRVMIYDVDAGAVQPREGDEEELERYPEPEYRELDRARVLHVFREREESVVVEPIPGISLLA